MDEKDIELLKLAQDGVELTARPYQKMALALNLTEEEVIDRLLAMQEEGVVRRFAATIGHRALGIVANAMIAWKADQQCLVRAGQLFAAAEEVTHCYERADCPDWPYNLYTMVHSKNREDCLKIAERLSRQSEIKDYRVLFSLREYKKTSARI
jgi:DNA-binding Lrp family transcriptional regulator